jgi:predicted MFS family arabinose efflux permease
VVALVYAITRFGEDGFTDAIGLGLVGAAVVLLAVFVKTQGRSRTPLVPLSLFRNRGRAGAYASMLLLAIGPMGTFYVLTLYLQQVQHFSPLQTGMGWLPFAAGIVVGAGTAPKLLSKVAPRVIAAAGAFLSAAAAFWFSFIQVNTNYWLHLAPAMFVLALGFGLGVIALTQAAVYHTAPHEAGIASALLNSAQQIGVALGLAVLAGIAATVTGTSEHRLTDDAQLVAGYGSALAVAAGMLIVAGILAAATLPAKAAAQADGTYAAAAVTQPSH